MTLMRNGLLTLSRNPKAQDLIVGFPLSRNAARRFVAGEQLSDAIDVIRRVNAQGMVATLDFLGESVSSQAEATAAADEYMRALDAIQHSGVQSTVSLKLTAMGLDIADDFCLQNVGRIVQRAAHYGNRICVDMEGSAYTDRALAIVRELRRAYKGVATVIQAYLKRSEDDVRHLIAEGAELRLVKGAYDEPESVAFRDKGRVDACLVYLADMMLAPAARAQGAYPAIGSHDDRVIAAVQKSVRKYHVPSSEFEFQMLYGVRRDLQLQLAQQGYTMRVYIPYGTHWYPYFMRRLAERPANLLFFIRSLVGG